MLYKLGTTSARRALLPAIFVKRPSSDVHGRDLLTVSWLGSRNPVKLLGSGQNPVKCFVLLSVLLCVIQNLYILRAYQCLQSELSCYVSALSNLPFKSLPSAAFSIQANIRLGYNLVHCARFPLIISLLYSFENDKLVENEARLVSYSARLNLSYYYVISGGNIFTLFAGVEKSKVICPQFTKWA